jgi:hypothetical protein
LTALAAFMPACAEVPPFACESDAQCGADGRCEDSGACSFPDEVLGQQPAGPARRPRR